MISIEFKFELGQKVFTPHREEGFVSILGFDHSDRKYYVLTKSRASWFCEEELASVQT